MKHSLSAVATGALFLTLAGSCDAQGSRPTLPPKPQAKSGLHPLALKKTKAAGVALGGLAGAARQFTRRSNKLRGEGSPYLLQHAWNPVDWQPWSDAAFAQARREDKPVFLSVGYSTCHWCHVMERESFESYEIAAILNESFVCIKLDREERPDLDEHFMAAVQMFSRGHGGWPMTLFLDGDRKPFFGGTYFPPEGRWGRPGFRDLTKKVRGLWKTDRKRLLADSASIVAAIRKQKTASPTPGELPADIAKSVLEKLWSSFDTEHGGFGRAPKFPGGMTSQLLMRLGLATKDPRALKMVTKTLDAMASGGMYDQVGGGFHRYSTDREWFVPHFEKMLYDNGLLAKVYADAACATGHPRFGRVAREIVDYLLRDMQLPEGGFASAEDADSEGEEGLFYLWNTKELRTLLSPAEAELVEAHYGLLEKGNWPEAPQNSANIFAVKKSLAELAAKRRMPLEKANKLLASAKATLLAARARRVRPLRDDKVITAWNGLAISGIARVARLTGEPRYRKAARKAASFVLSKLVSSDGRLLRRYRNGAAKFPGVLDDYAYFIAGLLDLYEADQDPRWMVSAIELEKSTRRLFWDAKSGGFFRVGHDVKDAPTRSREATDGARPAAAAVAAMNMLRLADFTRNETLRALAKHVVAREAGMAGRWPRAYVSILAVHMRLISAPREVIVAGHPGVKETKALLHVLGQSYMPNSVTVLVPPGEIGLDTRKLLAKLCEGRVVVGSSPAAYVCQNMVCLKPVLKPAELKASLERK